MSTEYKHSEITEAIIGAAYNVYNTLGAGFLEKVYENALAHELREAGKPVRQQEPLDVVYHGARVGQYFADLIVEGRVIVEVKAVESIGKEHLAQLVNYLKATGIAVGLLINFGPRLEVKRRIFDLR